MMAKTNKFGPPLTKDEERIWRVDADGVTEDDVGGARFLCGRVLATLDVERRALEKAKDLLRDVITGEDILTDRKWLRAAKRLVDAM